MLLFEQSGVVLAFSDPKVQFLLGLLPTRMPRAFSVDLLLRQSVTSLCHCPGLFDSKSITQCFALLNFISFLLAIPSCLATSL